MPKFSNKLRGALLGVLLIAMGYLGGQPGQIVQGVTAVVGALSLPEAQQEEVK